MSGISHFNGVRLTSDCRYEDEKVIQALEIVKAETGLPFVSYT